MLNNIKRWKGNLRHSIWCNNRHVLKAQTEINENCWAVTCSPICQAIYERPDRFPPPESRKDGIPEVYVYDDGYMTIENIKYKILNPLEELLFDREFVQLEKPIKIIFQEIKTVESFRAWNYKWS